MSDERLKKSVDNRESRAMNDRPVTEERALSDDDRVAMFRQQFFQSALPDLPSIPGWHTCWLTTVNPRDSIHTRIRLGYQPIRPDEIPGWEHTSIKTGEWAGYVGVNEMLAFKLPMNLYEMYMREAHHDAPLREDEKLLDTVRGIQQQAQRIGGDVKVGDGMSDIGDKRIARFDLR